MILIKDLLKKLAFMTECRFICTLYHVDVDEEHFSEVLAPEKYIKSHYDETNFPHGEFEVDNIEIINDVVVIHYSMYV